MSEVFVITADLGNIIEVIDTGVTPFFDRKLHLTVYADTNFIYITCYNDSAVFIYDVKLCKLIKKLRLPSGYHPKAHKYHNKHTGKQYFTLHNKTQYVAQAPVLEINPADLDSPIEFEQEPEMNVELTASKEIPQEQELVISMNTASLDDALRFGEIYTRDYSQWHSYNYMGMSFTDRKPTKNFNGIIRFIYSGCDQSADVVNKHLRVMEKRFAAWNENEGFYSCTDKKQPTRLIAEYVS